MPTYCAFLGHQPHVSLAELCVLLPDLKVQKLWSPYIMTFETSRDLTVEWLRGVGGTVLIARELSTFEVKRKGMRMLPEIIPPLLQKSLTDSRRKVTFSLRCFSVPRPDIRNLYRQCKQYLRSKRVPSRYIGNERNPAKPGTLLLRGIPGPGTCELVILFDEGKKVLWVGATCAVQDIQAYTERDMGKPFRDLRSGLLPPKLAQVMLNFSLLTMSEDLRSVLLREEGSSWEKVTVWDPFCGSGVILLEALLHRAHVLGSDKSERAVKGIQQNIKWFRERAKTPRTVTHELWKQSAMKPAELPCVPTVIVTETSLGPALTSPPTKREIATFLREAEELERAFFQALATSLPEIPVVCTFPVFIDREGTQYFLPRVLADILKLGYRLTFPGCKQIRFTNRHTLLYLRPDQFVGREILCFLPPKKSSLQTGKKPSAPAKTRKKH